MSAPPVLFADLLRCLAPSSSQSSLLKSWETTNATLCGKKATGDAQGRTQAKGTALTGALKENAVLQSLAWKARQLRSRDGMLPDQLNLPNQLREINRRSEELRAMGAAASKPPKEERGTLHPRAAAN